MATVKQCRSAINTLATVLDTVDDETRAKHLPRRTVLCMVKDLDIAFSARLDETGVHDITQVVEDSPTAEVRVSVASDDLVALANGDDDLLSAWLHGRVHVSAPMRDMLRLRSILGL
jgi:predicted lipid carrier protein YhbT